MIREPFAATPPPGLVRPTAQRLAGLFCLAAALLPACAPRLEPRDVENTPPSVLAPAQTVGVVDGRGRFREIFNDILRLRGASLPDAMPPGAGDPLWRLAREPGPTGRPVPAGLSRAGLTIGLVPGLLAECVAEKSRVFEDARANLEAQGYATASIQTGGRLGSARNARIIRDAVLAMPPETRLVLVTHSKGAVDAMEALASFPELAGRVLALVAVSGAVNGSPVADAVPGSLARFVEEMRLATCPPGEGMEAVESLRRRVRLDWLAAHRLPQATACYSLPAFARRENISAVLKPFHDILSASDPLNDSLVLCSDAVIPGSTLLGYPNADHLAVAMPFAEKNPLLAATLITRNHYPRAVLLEAVARFVEEDLRNRGRLP